MKQFSVDEILDDIKRKKGEEQPKAAAPSVDIDRLLAEIRGEKSAPVKEEPKTMPVVTRTIREESVRAEAPVKKVPDPEQPKEKFTVKIDFSKTFSEPVPEPKREEAPPALSTVDILAESAADQIEAERPEKREEPAPAPAVG